MRRQGWIVARTVAPDTADCALVELDPDSACARCAAGRGCAASLFSAGGRPIRLNCRIPDTMDSAIGQSVEIDIVDPADRHWLISVALAYGLPTVGLLAGALLPEPWAPAGALLGVVGGILAWRAIARIHRAALPGVLDVHVVSVHPVGLRASGGPRPLSGELP